MTRVILTFLAALAATGAVAAVPLHSWDFEKTDAGKAVDGGSASDRHLVYGGERRTGQGFRGSTGLWIGKGSNVHAAHLPLDLAAFTVDLRFRLDGPVDAKEGHALWTYAWNSWRRGRVKTRITKDGRLEVHFARPASKDGTVPTVDFTAASEPLALSAGAFHQVRVAVTADGLLTAYLDGELVAKKAGCPGLRGIRTEPPKWYPLLRLGQDDDALDRPKAFLNGVLDDVAIYSEALGAPEPEIAEARGDADDAGGALVLVKGEGRTSPFTIKDKEGDGIHDIGGGAGLGGFVRSAEKFQKCRARATLAVKDDFITVTVACPVPVDVAVVRRTDTVWRGDAVEVFLRPDPEKPTYFHYAVNAAGLTAAGKYADGAADKSWTSGFTGACADGKDGFTVTMRIPRQEVFPVLPEDGTVFAAQFIREGPTTDGVASWMPTGTAFHDPATFGRVVYGSCGAYFRRLVAAARASAAARFTSDAARGEATKAVDAFAAAVEKHGENAAAFGTLERLHRNLEQAFLQIAMTGRRLVAYRPSDIWGNRMDPDAMTRPLERIRIRAPKGGKAFTAFALANLSDQPFLGQVKVFDSEPKPRFSTAYLTGLGRHFTVHEGFDVRSGAGKVVWDPVAPLMMGTVIRIAPHATSTVWLELDTHGLEAGRHTAVLYVKRGHPGFETERIPVEVEIVDADLGETAVDRGCYTYMTTHGAANRRFAEFLTDHGFNLIYMGTPGQQSLRIYNRYEKDGTLVPGDMTQLDAIIDAHLRAGMARERVKLWFFLAFEGGYGPGNAGPLLGERWNAAVRAFLVQLYAHVRERYGITADRIVLYPFDEPKGDVDDPKSKMGKVYLVGKAIKGFSPDYRLMVNPLPGIPEPEWRKALVRLSECYDFIEFYRPGLTPQRVQFAKTLPYRGFWTYSIIGKETHPSTYRGDYWENMRDGFTEIATFWHLDSMAGGDGFDSADASEGSKNYSDYGSVYADFDQGGVISSRRQIAADIGYEDVRLIAWCRARTKGDAARAAKVEAIVKAAADGGTMADMDRGREALLDLAAELSK